MGGLFLRFVGVSWGFLSFDKVGVRVKISILMVFKGVWGVKVRILLLLIGVFFKDIGRDSLLI